MPFEEPYWAGQHPAVSEEEQDDYPDYTFPFHPLELGEAALYALFGYHLEGPMTSTPVGPESIPLVKYAQSRTWWNFWK